MSEVYGTFAEDEKATISFSDAGVQRSITVTPKIRNVPRYSSLGAALSAIAAEADEEEVVEFQDSATYSQEDLTWPGSCQRLMVQAAEGQRPVIEIAAWGVAADASYEEFGLLGLRFRSGTVTELTSPPAAVVSVSFCTVASSDNTLAFSEHGDGASVTIQKCLTAGLQLDDPGRLVISDSVVDAGKGHGAPAIFAEKARILLDRVTVFGTTKARVLEASEVYFDEIVSVEDRFDGCVRYSRVTSGSTLPKIHRVVKDVDAVFVSTDRQDPAHARLAEGTAWAILHGSEDGGEIGAFHDLRMALRYASLLRRLIEYTPAGLATGVLRAD
jgi:hypothetical protein